MAFERAWMLGAASGDAPILYSAREARLPLDALVYTSGVCSPYDLQVTQRAEGANQSVDIAAGIAIIAASAAGLGKFVVRNNAKVNFTGIPGLPASGTRRHLLCVQVHDKQNGAGADYDTVPLLVEDTVGDGNLPSLTGLKNVLPIGEIRRTAGQSSGLSVVSSQIFPARQLYGVMPSMPAQFDFWGGNGQRLDRNTTTKYEPFGVRRAVTGCTVSDPTKAAVTNLLPGPWTMGFSVKINGNSAGLRAVYILVTAPDGTQWRYGNPGGTGDASGTPMSVSAPIFIPGPGYRAEAFLYQNVQGFTNINDEGGFAHFTGMHHGSVPGILLP